MVGSSVLSELLFPCSGFSPREERRSNPQYTKKRIITIKNKNTMMLRVTIIPNVRSEAELRIAFEAKAMRKKRVSAIKLAPAAGELKTMPGVP